MTRAERVRALLDEYARQRYQNEREQREREREAFARDPELEALRARSVSLAAQSLRAAMNEPDADKRRAIAGDMRQKGALLNAETRRRLRALGLPEDYLEEHYRCPVCRDTGYVGDAPARFCACFERRLAMGEQGRQGAQTFEAFNAAFVPEENGQRARLLEAKGLLEEFADRYPQARWRNIVLSGAGGLGKSFLLNCVYERVNSRGFAATRTTAYRMFDAMRRRHVGDAEDADGFAALLETPFLLVDDLGTEPMMRNITVEYLFLLVNERMEAGLSTMATTNLTPAQIQERYGERVCSRLFDRASALTIKLEGKDLRLHGIR